MSFERPITVEEFTEMGKLGPAQDITMLCEEYGLKEYFLNILNSWVNLTLAMSLARSRHPVFKRASEYSPIVTDANIYHIKVEEEYRNKFDQVIEAGHHLVFYWNNGLGMTDSHLASLDGSILEENYFVERADEQTMERLGRLIEQFDN